MSDGHQVRDEQVAREALTARRLEQERFRRDAGVQIEKARTEIAEIESGGVVASDAVVSATRNERDENWARIRAAFVEGVVDGSRESREGAAADFEGRVAKADRALRPPRRRGQPGGRAHGTRTPHRGSEQGSRLGAGGVGSPGRRAGRARAGVRGRLPGGLPIARLARALLDFATRRADVLVRNTAVEKEAAEIAIEDAEHKLTLETLERLEELLGLGLSRDAACAGSGRAVGDRRAR